MKRDAFLASLAAWGMCLVLPTYDAKEAILGGNALRLFGMAAKKRQVRRSDNGRAGSEGRVVDRQHSTG